jgi:hypothetical protein
MERIGKMSKLDDTSWESLFWSLMGELEELDDEEATELWETYEQAGLQLDADENNA